MTTYIKGENGNLKKFVISGSEAGFSLYEITEDGGDSASAYYKLLSTIYGELQFNVIDDDNIAIAGVNYSTADVIDGIPLSSFYKKAGLTQSLLYVQYEDDNDRMACVTYYNGKLFVFTSEVNGKDCVLAALRVRGGANVERPYPELLNDSVNVFEGGDDTIYYSDFLDIISNYGLQVVKCPVRRVVGDEDFYAPDWWITSECNITDLGL